MYNWFQTLASINVFQNVKAKNQVVKILLLTITTTAAAASSNNKLVYSLQTPPCSRHNKQTMLLVPE